ncbi:MAG: tetratricopeptide repeat protein, partial [Pseudomonadota bacterium]
MWEQTIELWGLKITLYQLLVLGVFAGLAVGYLLAVYMTRRHKSPGLEAGRDKERAASNVAFMKGINYILADKPDQAIEELTRAVSVDTETVETYLALGNLFRSKGEIERAIRIRQSIILRQGLDEKIRREALFDLGVDYRHGGFYERAVKTFEEVIDSGYEPLEAYRQLIEIYEDTRDWGKASQTLEKMSRLTGERPAKVLAHYQVELGKEYFEKGELGQAKAAYKRAIGLEPKCVDAYLHLGDLHLHEGKPKKAVAAWHKLIEVSPDMVFLTFGRLARVALDMKDTRLVESFLAECAARGNSLARLALALLLSRKGSHENALEELTRALDLEPNLIEARRELGLLLLSLGRKEEALEAYRNLLVNLSPPEAKFQCGQCGFESKELSWRCPQCHSWDTMILVEHRPHLSGAGPPEISARSDQPGES